MSNTPGQSRTRRLALWLLVSLLPMLTFAGHWPTHIDIPGTDLYIALPLSAQAHSHDEANDGHGRHCHANAASCSDVPAAAGAGFALLNETIAILGVSALLIALALCSWQPRRSFDVAPELRPPKSPLVCA